MSKLQNLVVDSPSKIGKFEDKIKSGKISVVLVYAEWCGACHRFRDNIWDPMLKSKARHNRIAIRDDMVKNSPISKNWKFDYLPSLIVVDEKGVAQTFQQPDGSIKNAMKTPKDVKEMTRIVNVPVQPLASAAASAAAAAATPTPQEVVANTSQQVVANKKNNNLGSAEVANKKNKNINTLLAEAEAEEAEEEAEAEQEVIVNTINKNKNVNTLLAEAEAEEEAEAEQEIIVNTKNNKNVNTVLANQQPKTPFANVRNSLNLANEDIIKTTEVKTPKGIVYIPTPQVAPQRGGALLKTLKNYIRSQRKTRRKIRKSRRFSISRRAATSSKNW
jgi:thiol-disulfide isomerase/thioredoxin